MLLCFLRTGRGVIKETAPRDISSWSSGPGCSHCGVETRAVGITVHFLRLKGEGNKCKACLSCTGKTTTGLGSFRIKSKFFRQLAV